MSEATHHIIEIPEREIVRYVPKELAHCSEQEFKDVASLLFDWQSNKITYPEFRVQAIYRLMGLKKGKRTLNKLELENMFSNIEHISFLMDSFFDNGDEATKKIKLNLIDNPVPELKLVSKTIKGPKARFIDTTYGQYEDALHYYAMFYKTQNVDFLWKLFYTYYQSNSYDKRKTEKYIAKYKATTDFSQVFGFFLYFESFMSYVGSSKVVVEGNVIDLSIIFSATNESFKSDIPGLGAKSLSYFISKTGIMGDLEKTRQSELWEMLLLLYDVRKNELDEKKMMKEAKRNSNNG